MEFHEQENYTIDDIQALIDNHAEEGVHLELKRADALSEKHADKITKAFSAFANSDGGLVIYGIAEGHITKMDYHLFVKTYLSEVLKSKKKKTKSAKKRQWVSIVSVPFGGMNRR